MKHSLIILSIFIFSSFLTSCEKKEETLYRWGKSTDLEYVWEVFGDKETHPVYKGEVENGVPNGLGVMIYPKGSKYVGGWKDGRMNGQGTITWSDGGKYVGEHSDGFFWNGTRYDKNGKIQLKFVNGKMIKPRIWRQ